jgi:hypothetical protein
MPPQVNPKEFRNSLYLHILFGEKTEVKARENKDETLKSAITTQKEYSFNAQPLKHPCRCPYFNPDGF